MGHEIIFVKTLFMIPHHSNFLSHYLTCYPSHNFECATGDKKLISPVPLSLYPGMYLVTSSSAVSHKVMVLDIDGISLPLLTCKSGLLPLCAVNFGCIIGNTHCLLTSYTDCAEMESGLCMVFQVQALSAEL